MMKKSQIIETVAEMPDEFSIDEIIERLIVLEKIEKGQQDIKQGNVYSEKEAKERLHKWLK
jgi:Zn-dependent alcohol dehydrogenase